MKKIPVKELSLETIGIYGTFCNMLNPTLPKIGPEPVEFFRDMVQQKVGSKCTSYSICRVLKRPLVIDTVEMHKFAEEGILPLDGDVVIHVGLPTPNGEIPLDRLEAFRVPRGTFVILRRGVWHHAPFALDGCVNTLVVLPERTYADDCFVYEIPDKDKVAIGE